MSASNYCMHTLFVHASIACTHIHQFMCMHACIHSQLFFYLLSGAFNLQMTSVFRTSASSPKLSTHLLSMHPLPCEHPLRRYNFCSDACACTNFLHTLIHCMHALRATYALRMCLPRCIPCNQLTPLSRRPCPRACFHGHAMDACRVRICTKER